MVTQNITLSVPKDVLRKVKMVAAKRGTSLSALLTRLMNDLASMEEGYQAARHRHLELMDVGLDLGTGGTISWKRGELHER